jgi:hypothetical protein
MGIGGLSARCCSPSPLGPVTIDGMSSWPVDLASVDEVLALCREVFPDGDVSARARLVLEDVFDER